MNASRILASLLVMAPFAVLACSGDDDNPGNEAGASSSGAVSSSGGSSGSSGSDGGTCDRAPRADDARRFLAASRPYADSEANPSGKLSVFSLDISGAIAPVSEVEMAGSQSYGSLAISPDGRIGAIAYDAAVDDANRGAIGVFRLDEAGNVSVVHSVFRSEFTAADTVQFSADGEWLYVTDGNTVANGGGVYAAKVACDGTLGAVVKVSSARSPSAPFWLHADSSRGLIAGDDFQRAAAPADSLHLLSFGGAQGTYLGGANVTGTLTSIRYIAISQDDKVAILSAWNENLGGPRFLAAGIDGDRISLIREWGDDEVLGGAEVALASPYGNAFFLTSAFQDRAYRLAYSAAGFDAPDAGQADAGDAGSARSVFGPLQPITTSSVPPLVHGNPQLSSTGTVIERGTLKGRIVIGEVAALRQFQFNPDGTISDVARLETGDEDDITASVGSIGITP